jgi:hypothetical protein
MDVVSNNEPVAYHFSASKWAALTKKFSQPECWYYFKVSYAASRFASERLKVLARSREQALEQILGDTFAEFLWYRETDSEFVPTNRKILINE